MNFDARAAKLLRAGEHLTVDDAPGLRLVRSATRSAWTYRYRSPVDGRMRQVKLGTWPAMSAASAWSAWESLRAVRDAGGDPGQDARAAKQAAVVAAREAGTVLELLEAYLAGPVARRAPKGRAECRRLLMTKAASLHALRPEQVTRAVAFDLVNGLRDKPVTASQVRRELGAAWDWAHDSGRLPEDLANWWRLVLRGKLASKGKIVDGKHQGVTKRALSVEEVGAVLRHLPHISAQIADLLTLYLWTGCRGDELVAMEGRELSQDAEGWWWTIPRSKLKMSTHPLAVDLRVPLIGRALELVLARRDVHGAGYLFPARKGSKLPHVDHKIITIAVWSSMPGKERRSDRTVHCWPVVCWAPHDLRRTVRTQLAALGCPSDVAEAIIGHIQPGIEGVYNRHDYAPERRAWLTRLAEVWEQAAAR
jgi:integrase